MKPLLLILIVVSLTGCTTTALVDSWKSPEIDSYSAYKVLVVGMTSNIEARIKFESQIKRELESRGVKTVMSVAVFDANLRTEKMTTKELDSLERKLVNDGFDTVLFSKVVGVEDKIAYKKNYDGYKQTFRRFEEDYLMYQDIYYNPEYYDEYTVYHAETSMYCICPTKESELIWKGYIDITEPLSIHETIEDYVNLIILVLEEQKLINPKIFREKGTTEKELFN